MCNKKLANAFKDNGRRLMGNFNCSRVLKSSFSNDLIISCCFFICGKLFIIVVFSVFVIVMLVVVFSAIIRLSPFTPLLYGVVLFLLFPVKFVMIFMLETDNNKSFVRLEESRRPFALVNPF